MIGRRSALVLALLMVIPPGLTGVQAGETTTVADGEPLQDQTDHPFWAVMASAYGAPAQAALAMTQDADGSGAVDYLDRLSRLAGATGHASTPVEVLAWTETTPSQADEQALETRSDVRSATVVPGLDALFVVAAAGSLDEVANARGIETLAWAPRVVPQTHADGDPRTGAGPPAEGERTEAINASLAWRMGADGEGTTIGVADTGIDTSLDGFAGKEITWFDAIDDRESPFDPEGHGTRVARLAASAHGGAAPEADLAIARVMTGDGGTILDLAEGLAWFEEVGVDVVLLPFTARGPRVGNGFVNFQGPLNGGESDVLGWDTLVAPFAQDVPTVAAAGNVDVRALRKTIGEDLGILSWQSGSPVGVNGVNQVGSPGFACSVITVGMINEWYTHQPRSAAGPGRATSMVDGPCPIKPDLVSRTLIGFREPADATSEAAAIVGGAVAALLSHAGDLTPSQVRQTLTETAQAPPVKPGGEGLPRPNTATGYGVPDLTEAVKQHAPVDPGITEARVACWVQGCTLDAITNAPVELKALIGDQVVGTSQGRVHELALPAGTEEVTLRAAGEGFQGERSVQASVQTGQASREVTLYGRLHDNDPRSPEHMEMGPFGPGHTSFPMQVAPAPIGPDVVGFDLTPPAARGLHLGPEATAFLHLGVTSTGQTHVPGALLVNVSARLLDNHGVLGETAKTVLLTSTRLGSFGDNAQEVRLPFTLDRTRTSADGELRLEFDWSIEGGADPGPLVVLWARHRHPNGISLDVHNLEHSTASVASINDEVRLVRGRLSTVFGSVFVDPDTFTATGTDGLADADVDAYFDLLDDTWLALVRDSTGGSGALELAANTRQGNPLSASIPLDLPGASAGPNITVEMPSDTSTDRPIPVMVTTNETTSSTPTVVGDWFDDPVELDETSPGVFEGELPSFEGLVLLSRDHTVLVTLGSTVEERNVHIGDFRDPYVPLATTVMLEPVPLPGGPTVVRWDPTAVRDDNDVPSVRLRVGNETSIEPNDGSTPIDVPPGQTRKVQLQFIDAYNRTTDWVDPIVVPGLTATSTSLSPADGTVETVPVRVAGSVAPFGSSPPGAKRVAEADCPLSTGEQSNGFPCMAAAMAEPGMVTFQLADFIYTVSPFSLDAQPSRPTLIRLDVRDTEGQKTALLAYNSLTSQLRPAGRVPGIGIDAWGWIAGGSNALVISVPAHELEGPIQDTHIEFATPGSLFQPSPLASLNETIEPLPAPPSTEGHGEILDGWVAQSGGHLVTMLNTTDAAQGSRIDVTVDVVRDGTLDQVTVAGVLGGGAMEGPGQLRSGTHHHVLRVPVLALLADADQATIASVRAELEAGATGRLDWTGPLALNLTHLDVATVEDEGCPAIERSLLAPWGALMLAQVSTSLCESTFTAQIDATVHDVVQHNVDGHITTGDRSSRSRHTVALGADRATTAPTQFTVTTFGGGVMGASGDQAVLETRLRAHTVIDHMDASTPYSVNATLDQVRIEPPEAGTTGGDVTGVRTVPIGAKASLPGAGTGPGVPRVHVETANTSLTALAPGGQVDLELPIDEPGHAVVPLDLTVRGTHAAEVQEHREITLNHRPHVDAAVETEDPITLEPVTATATASDPDGDAVQITWTVDGETVDQGPQLAWTPKTPGEHTIVAVAEDTWAKNQTELVVQVANRAPTVSLSPKDATVTRNTVLALEANASDPDDGLEEITWTVDGEPAGTGPTLERAWTDPGTHTIQASAVDRSGETANASTTLTVTNTPPSLDLGTNGTVRVETLTPVKVNITASDSENDTLEARIDQGPDDAELSPIPDGFRFNWTPQRPGTYEVVIVVDDGDSTDQANLTIEALNRAPELGNLTAPSAVETLSSFTVSADAMDPDGAIVDWRWRIDGTLAARTAETATLELSTPGEHTVTLVVEDDTGATASSSTTVDGLNRAPLVDLEASLPGPAPAIEEEPLLLQARGSDPDGDAPKVRILVDGTEEVNGTGQVDATVSLAEGDHELVVEATDALGATSTMTRTLEVDPNSPPTAGASAPSLDAPGLARLTSNASDPEDRPLDHAWRIDDAPVASGPEATYEADTAGLFSVSLEVADPSGASDTATTTLLVDDGLLLEDLLVETDGGPVLILRMQRAGVEAPPSGTLEISWGPLGLPVWSETQEVEHTLSTVQLDRIGDIEHEVQVTWTAQSAPGAPIQDEESVNLTRAY